MYHFLPYAPSYRTAGQFLRPVEAIGLTAGGSIQQLTAFDYADSELRQVVVASDEYAIPATQQAVVPLFVAYRRFPNQSVAPVGCPLCQLRWIGLRSFGRSERQ